MKKQNIQPDLSALLRRRPQAWARVEGTDKFPALGGLARFYRVPLGVVTVMELGGLPQPDATGAPTLFFPEIMPEASGREGSAREPIRLPPLDAVRGYAFSCFLCDGFTLRGILGGELILLRGSPEMSWRGARSFSAGALRVASGRIRDR